MGLNLEQMNRYCFRSNKTFTPGRFPQLSADKVPPEPLSHHSGGGHLLHFVPCLSVGMKPTLDSRLVGPYRVIHDKFPLKVEIKSLFKKSHEFPPLS